MIKKELHIFCAALLFFTRIPCFKNLVLTEEHFAKSAKYFPLLGWIIGGLSALLYFSCLHILPHSIAIVLSMLFSILLTGGLHEDGLADVCDGFGGGWTKDRILAIMKDSATGVYGVIGIVMVLLMKSVILSESDPSQIPFLLIAGHAISRFVAITFMYTHAYMRTDETSKSKNVAQKMNLASLLIAMVFGLAPVFLFQNKFVFVVCIPLILTKWLLGRYFTKWIGGYTGDCLGATQQISEIVFYLFMLIAPWNYI
jgi:adenosylcobinamide-GDP ribazoletransferase